MKKHILLAVLTIACLSTFAQSIYPIEADIIRMRKRVSGNTLVDIIGGLQTTLPIRPGSDTTSSKLGVVQIGPYAYIGNGTYYERVLTNVNFNPTGNVQKWQDWESYFKVKQSGTTDNYTALINPDIKRALLGDWQNRANGTFIDVNDYLSYISLQTPDGNVNINASTIDANGNVNLAGQIASQADAWAIYQNGSANFAGSNVYINPNGWIGNDNNGSWFINADGSASFANNNLTIDALGNIALTKQGNNGLNIYDNYLYIRSYPIEYSYPQYDENGEYIGDMPNADFGKEIFITTADGIYTSKLSLSGLTVKGIDYEFTGEAYNTSYASDGIYSSFFRTYLGSQYSFVTNQGASSMYFSPSGFYALGDMSANIYGNAGISGDYFSIVNNSWFINPDGTNNLKMNPVNDFTKAPVSWINRNAPTNRSWMDVCRGNGLFVAIGRSPTSTSVTTSNVFTSPNGTTWTERSTNISGNWYKIAYGNGIYIVISEGSNYAQPSKIITSPDGITWTSRSDFSAHVSLLVFGNGLFIAVIQGGNASGNKILTSPDGITWTERSKPFGFVASVAHGNGLFVATFAYGSTGNIITSPDGINWTLRTGTTFSGNASPWGSYIGYGNGVFLVATLDKRYAISPDGINWTVTTDSNTSYYNGKIAYGGGIFIQYESRLAISGNGTNWISVSTAPGAFFRGIAYYNGIFVLASNTGIYTSGFNYAELGNN